METIMRTDQDRRMTSIRREPKGFLYKNKQGKSLCIQMRNTLLFSQNLNQLLLELRKCEIFKSVFSDATPQNCLGSFIIPIHLNFKCFFTACSFTTSFFLAKYNYLVAKNSTGNSGATRKHMLPAIQRAANRHIKWSFIRSDNTFTWLQTIWAN